MEENQQTEPLCDLAKFSRLIKIFKNPDSIKLLIEATNWDVPSCACAIEALVAKNTLLSSPLIREILEKTNYDVLVCKFTISILPFLDLETKMAIFDISHETCHNKDVIDEKILLIILQKTQFNEEVVRQIELSTEADGAKHLDQEKPEQEKPNPTPQKDPADCDGSCCDCC